MAGLVMANDGRIINAPVWVYTNVSASQNELVYAYHLVNRPPSIGTHPKDDIGVVSYRYQTYQDTIGRCAWGMVIYNRPLTQREVDEYELIPDSDTDCRYRQYAILRAAFKKAGGRKVAEWSFLLSCDGLVWLSCSETKAKEQANALDLKATESGDDLTRYFVRKVADASDIARKGFRRTFTSNPIKRAAGCS
ncbi:MAG: hypothetical protein PHS57_06095 [Alphaproteobacteria bacterium]|nr:hypothetical protein [Alphaproteobacteria bacterium]